MDALTRVRQRHRELVKLLEQLQKNVADDRASRRERAVLLARLRAAVLHHIDQEEAILYPIYRERARRVEVDPAPLDQAVEQHRLLERLARELTEAGHDGEGLRAKLTVLSEQFHNHLDTEDAVLLTAIEDLVDDDTLRELGRRMEQRERVDASRRELARTVTPGGRRVTTAVLAGLAAAALTAVLVRRRRPPPRRWPPLPRGRAGGWRRTRGR